MFTLEGSVWTKFTKLEQSDGLENGGFGTHVAISPEVAVVGAQANDLMSIEWIHLCFYRRQEDWGMGRSSEASRL